MECSFAEYSGAPCGVNPRYTAERKVVSLSSCQKDITSHLAYYKFSGIATEVDLILSRTGTFSYEVDEIAKLMICPFHRDIFGTGWKRPTRQCTVPDSLAAHKKGRAKPDRGIGKEMSQNIRTATNCLIPVGSGELLFDRLYYYNSYIFTNY